MIRVLALLFACQDDPEPPPPTDGSTSQSLTETAEPTTTGDTASTSSTAETGTTGVEPLCESPYTFPFPYVSTPSIITEEDFDFDAVGHLLTQSGSDLLGVARDGSLGVLAANVGIDVAGIRSLPTGDVIVAQQDTAAVRLVNLASGGSTTVLSGLDFPNGLEVGEDGQAYVSEYSANGRVRMFDPYTGASEVILEIAHPNGLALSPDEETLYIAVSEALFSGSGRVMAIERDTNGDWDAGTLRLVYQADDLLDALAVDVCGNVYVTTYRTGHVLRLWTDGSVEELVDLPNVSWEGYCAARFGDGIGDWKRDTLYVSDRYGIYAIEIGVDGRHVLAP